MRMGGVLATAVAGRVRCVWSVQSVCVFCWTSRTIKAWDIVM